MGFPEKRQLFLPNIQQHRRRVSLPCTPPETPADFDFFPRGSGIPGYQQSHQQPQTSHAFSPPPTPIRTTAPPLSSTKEQLLPSYMSSPHPNKKIDHRRMSSTSLRKLDSSNINAPKILAIFIACFAGTWLASSLFNKTHTTKVHKVVYYAAPSAAVEPIPAPRNQRWGEKNAFRNGPQQVVVGNPPPNKLDAIAMDNDIIRSPKVVAGEAQARRRRPAFEREGRGKPRRQDAAPPVPVIPDRRSSEEREFDRSEAEAEADAEADAADAALVAREEAIAAARAEEARSWRAEQPNHGSEKVNDIEPPAALEPADSAPEQVKFEQRPADAAPPAPPPRDAYGGRGAGAGAAAAAAGVGAPGSAGRQVMLNRMRQMNRPKAGRAPPIDSSSYGSGAGSGAEGGAAAQPDPRDTKRRVMKGPANSDEIRDMVRPPLNGRGRRNKDGRGPKRVMVGFDEESLDRENAALAAAERASQQEELERIEAEWGAGGESDGDEP
ncbi:hypothetical protein T439DRAFT_320243 [Meredithblackwellia eburnea MCA 4105]